MRPDPVQLNKSMLPPDTPPQVRHAILLLWIAQVLVVIDAVLSMMYPEPDTADETTFLVVVFVILLGLYATLITFAAKGKNWARITLLVLALITVLGYFLLPAEIPSPWWTELTTWLGFVLEGVALYWLFSGAGARWYASKASAWPLHPHQAPKK
jgi:hypothetical protein